MPTDSSRTNPISRNPFPIDILNLPQNVFEDVLKHLDDKSLSLMREVSKIAKDKLDSSILNVRQTEIEFRVSSEGNRVKLTFLTNCRRTRSILKIALNHAEIILKMAGLTEFELFTDWCLSMSIHPEILERFLDYVESHAHNVQMKEIHFYNAHSDVIRQCSNLCEGQQCQVTIFERDPPDFAIWHTFIQRVDPPKFYCIIPEFNKDSVKFLLNVAEMVFFISVYVLFKCDKSINFISSVREIFNRKCEELRVCDMTRLLSQSEIENLVEFFHGKDKKVAFNGYTTLDQAEIVSQLGEYRIEHSGYRGVRTNGKETSIKYV